MYRTKHVRLSGFDRSVYFLAIDNGVPLSVVVLDPPRQALSASDVDGISVVAALEELASVELGTASAAYVEAHIEQGRFWNRQVLQSVW